MEDPITPPPQSRTQSKQEVKPWNAPGANPSIPQTEALSRNSDRNQEPSWNKNASPILEQKIQFEKPSSKISDVNPVSWDTDRQSAPATYDTKQKVSTHPWDEDINDKKPKVLPQIGMNNPIKPIAHGSAGKKPGI